LKSAGLQYANALADIALEQGASEPVLRQLNDFAAAYAESAELRNVLNSPGVQLQEKHRVLEKLAARLGASKILRNFLFVIADHHRMHELPEIVNAFQDVLRQRQGVAEAQVTSAVPMTDAQKAQLLQALEKMTGKKIEAKYALEAGLLGGAVVRIGDTIYDGSVRNRLNAMRELLAAE
jgi:F-type H+-transporting ATPase subunit delta